MATVDVVGSCQFSADSIGLVWGLAATRRLVCIHEMNRVNSCNDFGHDDSAGRLNMHDLKMLDWKMTDNILANSEQNYGVWKMQDWKMTDKILANSRQNYGFGKCRTGK